LSNSSRHTRAFCVVGPQKHQKLTLAGRLDVVIVIVCLLFACLFVCCCLPASTERKLTVVVLLALSLSLLTLPLPLQSALFRFLSSLICYFVFGGFFRLRFSLHIHNIFYYILYMLVYTINIIYFFICT